MAQLKTATKILSVGISALEQIEKPDERAMAAAALLSSLAQLVNGKGTLDEEETESAVAAEGNRMSLSPEAPAVEAVPATEEVAPAAEEAEATDVVVDWTEEALDYKGIVEAFAKQCGKELIDDHYNYFTNGVRSTIDELSPLDVGAFVAYLYEQQNADEQAQ